MRWGTLRLAIFCAILLSGCRLGGSGLRALSDESTIQLISDTQATKVSTCTTAEESATYVAGGSGLILDGGYRVICTLTQLEAMSNDSTGWGTNYKLKNNIDMTSSSGFQSIGLGATPYSGTFEGNGYQIQNFTKTSAGSLVGFFGIFNGNVQNLGITDANVSGTSTSNTGILIGQMTGGTVSSVYTTGTVSSSSGSAGGLIGTVANAGSTITNAYSTANVSGATYAGGIAGQGLTNFTGSISNTYSTGNVDVTGSASNYSGGTIGACFASCSLTNSFSTGKITNTGAGSSLAGGAAGSATFATLSGVYWNSYVNSTLTRCGTGCTDQDGIDLNSNPTYFFDSANAPLSSWTFLTVWSEHSTNLPTLVVP